MSSGPRSTVRSLSHFIAVVGTCCRICRIIQKIQRIAIFWLVGNRHVLYILRIGITHAVLN